MKNLLLLLFFPFFAFCQSKNKSAAKPVKQNAIVKQAASIETKAPQAEGGFTIVGSVQGLADGEATLTTVRGDKKIIAKAPVKNGSFTLVGTLPEPGLFWLTMSDAQARYLFLDNSNIKISGTKADVKNMKIEGSEAHKDFAVFEKTFNPIFADLNGVVAELNRATEAQKPALMKKYDQTLARLNIEVDKFLAPRKNSFVSLFMISVTMQSNENSTQVEQRFNALTDDLKNSIAGKEIASYISYAKIGSIGSEAMDFTQNDLTDKPVSLSSFKGKYVLVDFWASWCRPCRMENPNVVKVFNKFKNKNFTVLGVSLDQEKQAWAKAVEKDKLTWTQVSDLQFWNNAAAQLYRVQSIPQNFLIDPQGKIVAKDLRGDDLERKLCEYLGCSN